MLTKVQVDLRSLVQTRGITSLYHFTPSRNTASILTHGFLSRQELQDRGLPHEYTDSQRLDGLGAVSFSIESINRPMLAQKRRLWPRDEWLIFEIDVSVLWTHRCRFCWTNAASNKILDHRGRLDGPWAFRRMFEGVDDNCPTPADPQAEVQVYDPIDRNLITAIGVRTAAVERELVELLRINNIRTRIALIPSLFV